MSAETDNREIGYHIENDGVSISAGESVKFHAGSGTDTATDRYLNIPGGISYGVQIVPTVDCSVVEINDRTLKAAISVDAAAGYTSSYGRFKNIKIQAGSATVVEVLMRS